MSSDPIRFALAVVLLAGCGGDGGAGGGEAPPTDMEPPAEAPEPELSIDPAMLPEGVTVEMVAQGRELFVGGGICFTCHLPEGTGGPLAPDLTDEQVEAVAAYAYMLSRM